MKPICISISLLLLTACYGSGGRSHIRGDDAATNPDTALDTFEDTSEDTIAPDTIEPDPACIYELVAERQISDEAHTVDAPSLFWDGSDVGLVGFEGGGAMTVHSFVSLYDVLPDLSGHTDHGLIGEESHGWGEIAWTGEALGLCWHSDPGFVGRTGFRLHDRDGSALGSRVDLDMDGEACLDLAYGVDRFLAAWRHYMWIDDDELWIETRIQVLDADGTPLGEPEAVAFGDYPGTTPALEWTGREFIAAVPGEDRIAFHWIGPDGTFYREAGIIAPGAAYCEFAMTDDGVAVLWAAGERWERGLYLTILDGMFEPVSGNILLEEIGVGANGPEVLAAPDGWILAWHVESEEDNHATLLHTDADGIPREPRRVIYEGRNCGYGGPAILQLEDDLFVAISHYPDSEAPSLEQMYMLKYTCEAGAMDVCAPQDADISWGICDDPFTVGWKWDGGSCQELFGCDCLGADCSRIARTRWDCLSDRWHCR
jgi:hypothetical protein